MSTGRLGAWALLGDPVAASIMSSGLRLRFHTLPPLTVAPPPYTECSPLQLPDIRVFVAHLLSRGIIRRILSPQHLFFSRLFLVSKKGGSQRLVIDLSRLNVHLIVPTFRMESVWSIAAGITEGLWGCTVDLEDAFYNVPLAPLFHKYFAFVVDGVVYVFMRMPFGLAIAPWAFSRVIRPVKGYCHLLGIRLHSYLDDFLILHLSPHGLQKDTAFLLHLFGLLGISINVKKSFLAPSQTVLYLGVVFSLDSGTLSLPVSKVRSIRDQCKRALSRSLLPRRALESLLGMLNFAAGFLPLGVLHLRPLMSWMNEHTSPLSRDVPVPLDHLFRDALMIWKDTAFLGSSVPMSVPVPSLQLMTDSSLSGWCGVLLPHTISGTWPSSFVGRSINWLELMAIKLSLEHFLPLLQGRDLLLLSDSMTSLACIRRQGTYRSEPLMVLTQDILMFCMSHSISLVPLHIRGSLNVYADQRSRQDPVGTEWSLDQDTFQWLSVLAGPFQVDLFATRDNRQLQEFVSPFPDPLAVGVDALSLHWDRWESIYLFPPVAALRWVVPLLSRYQGRGVLVAPLYAPSGWFPSLLSRSPDPVPLPSSLSLSQVSRGNLVFHADPALFRLHAWRL